MRVVYNSWLGNLELKWKLTQYTVCIVCYCAQLWLADTILVWLQITVHNKLFQNIFNTILFLRQSESIVRHHFAYLNNHYVFSIVRNTILNRLWRNRYRIIRVKYCIFNAFQTISTNSLCKIEWIIWNWQLLLYKSQN